MLFIVPVYATSVLLTPAAENTSGITQYHYAGLTPPQTQTIPAPAPLPKPAEIASTVKLELAPTSVSAINPNHTYTQKEILNIDLRKPCGIPAEIYENFLPNCYHHLIPDLIQLDKNGINGAWVAAIIITEVGWDNRVMAPYNYFNWTNDTVTYHSFDSPHDCMMFAQESFQKRYFNPDWHKRRNLCQLKPGAPITIERVNEHYAINADGTVNWKWSSVVSQLMTQLYNA